MISDRTDRYQLFDKMPESRAGMIPVNHYLFPIPEFNGNDPQTWLSRANLYFKKNPMDTVEEWDTFEKVKYVRYFMFGPAEIWFEETFTTEPKEGWESFCEKVLHHFTTPFEKKNEVTTVVSKKCCGVLLPGREIVSGNRVLSDSSMDGNGRCLVDECSLARKKAEADALDLSYLDQFNDKDLETGLTSLEKNELVEDYKLCAISKLPDFDTEKKLGFEGEEVINITKFNRGKLVRSWKHGEYSIRPLNPLGSFLDAEIYGEREREEEGMDGLIPAMSMGRVLISGGNRMFRSSSGSFEQFEGASGVGIGNFGEIGPLDNFLEPRNSTWLQKADLLFVDNPVGTGYSYVEDPKLLVTTDDDSATDLAKLLVEIFDFLPQVQNNTLYIVAESYGGKYAVTTGLTALKAIKAGKLKTTLGGIALGDSWIFPEDYVFSWGPLLKDVSRLDSNGLLQSNSLAVQIRADHQGCKVSSRSSWSCYFFPETSFECRSHAFELMRDKTALENGFITTKDNYTSKEIWSGIIPRKWGSPWSILQPTTEMNGSLIFHHRKMDRRWWRGQAVRYLMRFQSEYTCNLMNIARHAAFGMEAAKLVLSSDSVEEPHAKNENTIETFVWSNHKPWVPRPLVSMHVRMGDKAGEMKVVGFEDYMHLAKRIRKRFPHLQSIWLSTKMQDVVGQTKSYPAWKFYYTNVTRQTGNITKATYEASIGRETSTNYPIVNFLMATEADFFVGALGSTWCFLIDDYYLGSIYGLNVWDLELVTSCFLVWDPGGGNSCLPIDLANHNLEDKVVFKRDAL